MIVDYVTLLGHIRVPIISVRIVRMFRVFRGIPSGGPLTAGPAPSRFSDPAGKFAVLYGAETVACCLWETVVRNRLTLRWPREITRSIVTSRNVVAFDSTQILNLWTSGTMDPSCLAHLRLSSTNRTTVTAVNFPRPYIAVCQTWMAFCITHDIPGIGAARYLTALSVN